MSLSIGTALRGGVGRVVSRTGAILLAIYVPAMALYQLSINGLLGAVMARYLPANGPTTDVGVTYPAPTAVYAAVVLALVVGMAAFTVVAVRTFVAGATDRIPRAFYTRRLPWATANLLVGGLAFGLLVLLGSILLLLPGIVAYVGLIFTTMYVAVDDEHFVAALRHSWRLARPEFVRVFVLVFVLVVGMGVVGGVLGFALSLGTLLVGLDGWSGVATSVLVTPLSLLVLAVLSAAFAQLRDDEVPDVGETRPAADAPGTPSTPG